MTEQELIAKFFEINFQTVGIIVISVIINTVLATVRSK